MVQIYYRNTWGWVCDQQWDHKDADVVCRELGFEKAFAFHVDMSDNNDSGTWWLNNVRCIGNEPSIFSCLHDGLKEHSCESNKKATVVCTAAAGTKSLYHYQLTYTTFLNYFQPSFQT